MKTKFTSKKQCLVPAGFNLREDVFEYINRFECTMMELEDGAYNAETRGSSTIISTCRSAAHTKCEEKLVFQMKNGVKESATVFDNGTECCRVVLATAEQRVLFTLAHEEQMKFVQLDIESAQRKFDETRAILEKAVQEDL